MGVPAVAGTQHETRGQLKEQMRYIKALPCQGLPWLVHFTPCFQYLLDLHHFLAVHMFASMVEFLSKKRPLSHCMIFELNTRILVSFQIRNQRSSYWRKARTRLTRSRTRLHLISAHSRPWSFDGLTQHSHYLQQTEHDERRWWRWRWLEPPKRMCIKESSQRWMKMDRTPPFSSLVIFDTISPRCCHCP